MIPLLERLDKEEYETIIRHSKYVEIEKKQTIYNEGDQAKYLYFIMEGEIRIFKQMGRKKEITIFTRSNQDCFGEIGIFSGTKYSNTAEATRNGSLYYIEKDAIETLLKENGELGLHFTRWVAESLETSKAKMRDYIAFGSEGAVASVFIRYSNMHGIVTTEGIRLTEKVMLRDISSHIGVSRETVSRIVNKWKEQGIIENNNKHFLIKDVDFFKKLLMCENCGVEICTL